MVDFLPPENHAVSALLDVISDPKSAQKRLDQISKAQADFNAKIEESRALEQSSKEAQAAAEKARQEQEQLLKRNEEITQTLHVQLQDKITSYDKALQEHNQLFGEHEREHHRRTSMLDERELALNAREVAVQAREDDVTKREAEAGYKQRTYDAKLSKLKEIL